MRFWNRSLFARAVLGALCLSLSFNGWAEEGQPKSSCGKRVVAALNELIDRKLVKPVKENQVFKFVTGQEFSVAERRQFVKKMREDEQNAKENWEFQKKYWREVRESNGKRLLKTGTNTAKRAALIPYNQQMKYWTQLMGKCQEAKSAPGCVGKVAQRIILVERENPEKRNLRQYLKPTSWYSAPFTIFPELLRTKYTFSKPVDMILSMPGMIAATMAYDYVMIHGDPFHWVLQDMDVEAEEIPGVDYVLQLHHLDLKEAGFAQDLVGFNTPTLARKLMNDHAGHIFDWIDHQGDPKYLPRTKDFKDVGVLKSDAEVAELSLLAYKTYLSVPDKFKGADPEHDRESFPARLKKAWKKSLEKDPKFSKFSPEDKELLSMFFNPSVTIDDKSDLEILARSYGKKTPMSPAKDPLQALKGVAHAIEPVLVLKLAASTLENPADLEERQARWAKLFPNDDEPFLHRADIPVILSTYEVSFDSDGSGKNKRALDDEVSLWELAFKDPRFADIVAAYKKADLNEFESTMAVVERVAGYNDLYAYSRTHSKPELKNLCQWLESDPTEEAGVNSLIEPQVSGYLDLIRKPRSLTGAQEEGCRLDVAEYLYNSYIGEMKGMRGDGPKMQPKEFIHGLNRALSLCPLQSPPRSCPK